MASMIERYTVYWVNLGTVVICPITLRLHPRWPSRIQMSMAGKPAEIAIDQIRTINKSRIGDHIDTIDSAASAKTRHFDTAMYGVLAGA